MCIASSDQAREFRICVVDLMARAARGTAGRQFRQLINSGLSRLPFDAAVTIIDIESNMNSWDIIDDSDAVVVTGAEPCCQELAEDPVYRVVERVIAVCESRVQPIMFSCLSAHAALERLYAIPRRRLPTKRAGVFQHVTAPCAGSLGAGLANVIDLPHSRLNTVWTDDLLSADVAPVLVGVDGDWAIATSSQYTFLQGHPEYFGHTLLLEYRRDVRRFLYSESDTYPTIPVGYLKPDALAALERFMCLAVRRRRPDTIAEFPQLSEVESSEPAWSDSAATFMANWIAYALTW